jgi:hypothetical protein
MEHRREHAYGGMHTSSSGVPVARAREGERGGLVTYRRSSDDLQHFYVTLRILTTTAGSGGTGPSSIVAKSRNSSQKNTLGNAN